jgi:hypothetical protein
MPNKTTQALAIGITIWLFGMLAIIAFGNADWFPAIPIPIAFLTTLLMVALTRWHLRDVPRAERSITAIRFGVAVTAVQFPLDALAWSAIFYLGFPPLTQAAREMLMIALEIGYFAMLVVPWWVGRRQ